MTMLFRAELGEVDDRGDLQKVRMTGYARHEMTGVHRVQSHGLASNPPKGAHAMGFASRGEQDLAVMIGGEVPALRPKNMPTGTAVLYDDKGGVIYAKGDDGIVMRAGKGHITATPETGKFFFLGGDGVVGTYAFVSTVAGPSVNVKARIA